MDRNRLYLVLAVIAGILVTGGLAWRAGVFGAQSPSALPGGPFQLVDQDGRTVDQSVLKGRWSLVFFGFTACPDVCPTTLQALATTTDQLGPKAGEVQVVFITVDPGRDRPRVLKDWLAVQGVPVRTIGLTGTPQQIDAAVKAYRAFRQQRGEGADYQVDHSTAVYLMDPRGKFNRVLAYGLTPDQMADQIRAAMRGD